VNKLRGLCVTNSSSSSPDDRLFGKDLDFHLLDEFDNQADFSEQTVLVCGINGPTQGIDPGDPSLPQLALTRRQGVQDQFPRALVGERVSQSTFRFKAISLAPCSEEARDSRVLDGELSLVFTLHPKNLPGGSEGEGGGPSGIIDGVMAWSCPFVFTSDQGRTLKERACKEELEPLMTDLRELQEQKREVEDMLRDVEKDLEEQVAAAPAGGLFALVDHRATQLTLQDVSDFSLMCMCFASDILFVWDDVCCLRYRFSINEMS
jgi:hypothetical protein